MTEVVSLFDAPTIESMMDRLQRVLVGMVADLGRLS